MERDEVLHPPPEHRHRMHVHELLWLGMLAGPVCWLLTLQTAYALVQPACQSERASMLYIAIGVYAVLSIGGGVLSLFNWMSAGGGWPSETDDPEHAARRLMGVVGMMTSALFTLIILSHLAAVIIVGPCAW
jgi:hypothetical protein